MKSPLNHRWITIFHSYLKLRLPCTLCDKHSVEKKHHRDSRMTFSPIFSQKVADKNWWSNYWLFLFEHPPCLCQTDSTVWQPAQSDQRLIIWSCSAPQKRHSHFARSSSLGIGMAETPLQDRLGQTLGEAAREQRSFWSHKRGLVSDDLMGGFMMILQYTMGFQRFKENFLVLFDGISSRFVGILIGIWIITWKWCKPKYCCFRGEMIINQWFCVV